MGSTRERVADYRARMRASGMRPIQIWVPDVHARGFAAEAERQSRLVTASPHEAADQAWVDAMSEWPDE